VHKNAAREDAISTTGIGLPIFFQVRGCIALWWVGHLEAFC
jgi:hypothetical protein